MPSAILALARRVAQSHTATDQWQSFELRMRRRRIERCVRRATDALGAGTLDVATDAIEEAAHLAPGDEEIKALAAKIRAAAVPPAIVADAAPRRNISTVSLRAIDTPAPSAASRVIAPVGDPIRTDSLDGTIAFEEEASSGGSRHWFAIAVALIVLSGMTGWIWTRAQLASEPQEREAAVSTAQTTLPARVTESAAPATGIPSPEPASAMPPAPAASSPELASGRSGSAAEPPAAEPSALAKPLETSATPEPAVQQAAPESSALPAVALPAVALPPARATDKRTAATSAPAVRNAAPPPTPDARPAPVPATLAAEPAPTVAPPPIPTAEGSSLSASIGESVAARAPQVPAGIDSAAEERAIRAVLGRYEAAYNRLDAAAASAVRPSIDRQALSRAFEGLVSQTVRLGSCAVIVTGVSAQAACTGTAQWTPRIGGETQIAKRQWRFDMKKTGADWIIVSATVR
jgi:hypothetical protein